MVKLQTLPRAKFKMHVTDFPLYTSPRLIQHPDMGSFHKLQFPTTTPQMLNSQIKFNQKN